MGTRRTPLIETIPEGTFGQYLYNLLAKKKMKIKQFRLQADTSQPRITEDRFYALVRSRDRSVNWIDLIVFAQVLDSDPVEMIAMYMADKAYYKDLTKEEREQVAFNTFLLTILNLLPACERNDMLDIASMKARRHRIDLDKVRDELHHSKYASQRKKQQATEAAG